MIHTDRGVVVECDWLSSDYVIGSLGSNESCTVARFTLGLLIHSFPVAFDIFDCGNLTRLGRDVKEVYPRFNMWKSELNSVVVQSKLQFFVWHSINIVAVTLLRFT